MQALFDTAILMRIGSGMAGVWGSLSGLEAGDYHSAFAGTENHGSNSAIQARTIFDLASLTKILATTSLFMKWVDERIVDLDSNYPGKPFTFRQLLTHSSGLPAWKPFYESMSAHFGGANGLVNASLSERKQYFYELVNQVPLENKVGEKIVYSDLGFILLAHYAEQLRGKGFDQIVEEEVWSAIPGCDLHYRPLVQREPALTGVASTEECPWRGSLQGEVHDDNTWSAGGVAGHAGVFGSIQGVLAWTHALITGKLVSFATLHTFFEIMSDASGSRRAVGFDVPSLDGSGSTLTVFSPGSVGHLGFTGTSLWLDFDENRFAILLTNRVHPSRDDSRIRDLRKAFHRVAFN